MTVISLIAGSTAASVLAASLAVAPVAGTTMDSMRMDNATMGETARAHVQTLTRGEIEQGIAHAIALRLRAMGSTARIARIDGVRGQDVPCGDATIAVDGIAGRWPRRQAAVPVRLIVDGRAVHRLVARVALSDPRPVLVYAEDVPPRGPGGALILRPAMVDMTCCDDAPVASAADIDGLRLRRARRAGQPALRGDFEPIPDVLRRERIVIEVHRGPVRIALAGVALADGRIGERIAVLPSGAQAAVRARVSAKHKVEIDVLSP